MWNGLPVIRKGIAESMINDYGLSQKEAAEKLGITPAAVCQYISKKRGRVEIEDDDILSELKVSAQTIIENGGEHVLKETCRICKIMRNNKAFKLICPGCDD